jgi:hypothetical protein
MTRQAVTKHLVLLEAANLITVTWQGREKFHYLNPAPLHQISARWIDKYDHLQPVATPPRQSTRTATTPDTEGESRWTNLHTLDTTLP